MPEPLSRNPYKLSFEEVQSELGIKPENALDHIRDLLYGLESLALVELLDTYITCAYVDAYYRGLKDLGFPNLLPEEIQALGGIVEQIHKKTNRIDDYWKAAEDSTMFEQVPRETDRLELQELIDTELYDPELIEDIAQVLQEQNEIERTDGIKGIIFQLQKHRAFRTSQAEMYLPALPDVYFRMFVRPHVTYLAYDERKRERQSAKSDSESSPMVERVLRIENRSTPVLRLVPYEQMRGEYSAIYATYQHSILPQIVSSAYMPYAYEAHYSLLHPYGEGIADRNRLLMYQRAIEVGYIAGAAIELQGPLDPYFLEWILGSSAIDSGSIPDVEVIYSIRLPSGREYRFPLKFAQDPRGDLRMGSEEQFDNQDYAVVQNIRRLFLMRDKKYFISLLCERATHNDFASQSEMTQSQIGDAYQAIEARFSSRLNPLLEGAFNTYKEEIHTRMFDETILTTEFDEETAITLLRPNLGNLGPETKTFMNLSKDVQERILAGAGRRLQQIAGAVRVESPIYYSDDQNKFKSVSQKKDKARVSRESMGYPKSGIDNGYFLNFRAIIIDTIRAFMRAKSRSKDDQRHLDRYENPDDHFENLSGLKEFLMNSKLDRPYREVSVYDPEKRESEDIVTEKGIDEGKARKIRRSVLSTNCKRAESCLKKIASSVEIFSSKGDLSKEEEKAYQTYSDIITRYRKAKNLIELQKRDIREIQEEKEEAMRGANSKKKEIERSLDDQSDKIREELLSIYKNIVGVEVWNTFALRIVREVYRNTIKFTYAIRDSGAVSINIDKYSGDIVATNHSNLAGGAPVFAAGELIFEKIAPGQWRLREINNGSGHYKPHGLTLIYVTNILQQQGFDVSKARRIDSILRMDIDTNRSLRPDEVSVIPDIDII